MTKDLKTSCRSPGFMPWALSILRAYIVCEQETSDELICSETDKSSQIVTPNIFIFFTLSIPGTSGGRVILDRPLGLVNMISAHFDRFTFRLFVSAHTSKSLSSSSLVSTLLSGMMGYMSSANFSMMFPGLGGRLSDAVTTNDPGPITEPCIILPLICKKEEVFPANTVQCMRYDQKKKD